MGMFWMAAAYAARKRHSRHRRSSRPSNNHNEKRNTSRSESSFNYLSCLDKELAYDNPDLLLFFESINDVYNEFVAEEINAVKEQVNKIADEIDKKNVYFLKLEETLARLGIRFKLNTELGYYYQRNIILSFDDYELSSDYFLEGSKNNLSSIIADLRKKLDNNSSTISELEMKLDEINKKIAILPKKRQEKQNNINEINSNINKCTDENIEISKKIKLYEKINNLPLSIKELLKNCISEAIEKKELMRKKAEAENTINDMAYYYPRNNMYIDALLEKTMDKMMSDEKINEEILDNVFQQMAKVEIKARRKEYDLRSWCSTTDGKVERLNDLLKWFIKNVYEIDKNFVDNNYEIDDEEYDDEEDFVINNDEEEKEIKSR